MLPEIVLIHNLTHLQFVKIIASSERVYDFLVFWVPEPVCSMLQLFISEIENFGEPFQCLSKQCR
jgi:hypothetical protein